MFENRVLWRIFGPKRDEVTGGWRKVHNEELHNLRLNDEVKEDNMDRDCSRHAEKGNEHRIFGEKHEGKRPLMIPRRRWEDNIQIDL
jgi:hypothetical protein